MLLLCPQEDVSSDEEDVVTTQPATAEALLGASETTGLNVQRPPNYTASGCEEPTSWNSADSAMQMQAAEWEAATMSALFAGWKMLILIVLLLSVNLLYSEWFRKWRLGVNGWSRLVLWFIKHI